jgi:hypothetical protein
MSSRGVLESLCCTRWSREIAEVRASVVSMNEIRD